MFDDGLVDAVEAQAEGRAAREERLQATTQERDALFYACARLVRFIEKHGGYMSSEHQAALRNARVLLAEVKPAVREDGSTENECHVERTEGAS